METPQAFHTLKEVSEILNVHTMTVRNEIKRGNLKAIKVGKDYRIEDSILQDYIQNNEVNFDGNIISHTS